MTSMALCDIVYASDSATFVTPFMKLGFCAEGCASVIFPAVMGISKVFSKNYQANIQANEMLLLGNTFTAAELERCGLVSAVFPTATFHEEVLKQAEILAGMYHIWTELTTSLSSERPQTNEGVNKRTKQRTSIGRYAKAGCLSFLFS